MSHPPPDDRQRAATAHPQQPEHQKALQKRCQGASAFLAYTERNKCEMECEMRAFSVQCSTLPDMGTIGPTPAPAMAVQHEAKVACGTGCGKSCRLYSMQACL